MHRHQNSKHLRQRHGSDTLRMQPFDKGVPESPRNSPYREEDEENLFFPDASVSNPNTPRALEAGKGHSSSNKSLHKHSVSISGEYATNVHAQGLTSIPPPRTSSLTPFVAANPKLPDGAGMPVDEPARATIDYSPPPATWLNMPRKGQLAILCASRFVDFFQMAALQTFMVHQLKSFDPSQPDSVISHQAGWLQGSFTATQIVTSILWGRAADLPGVGRKAVLLIGLVGTGVGCIGVGFSSSFTQAVVWRMLSGAINGTVGSARTMVAETVDKRWHPRAFLLLPAAFNVANVLGPILSGLLVDPTIAYPHLFGPNSTFGGADGVKWMESYPYAMANLLSTVLLCGEAVFVALFLEETLQGFQGFDIGNFNPINIGKAAWMKLKGAKDKGYRVVNDTAARRGLLNGGEYSREGSVELDRMDANGRNEKGNQPAPSRLPFRRIWTSNVCWTLISIAIFDFHMGAFATLWILFLSAAREYNPTASEQDAPHRALVRSAFKFTGGLAFPPHTIGFAMAIIGFIGIVLQFVLYPWANGRFGLMRCFRTSLFFFPLAYFLAPYITLMPSSTESPNPASGFWVWLGIAIVVTLQVAARTFALPASIILLNNSSPHPSVLATIHGLGQADSATFRTIGPIVSSMWFGTWLERGVVGMSWWYIAAISALGTAASFKVRNGSGHEILLPGEEDESEDAPASSGPRNTGSGPNR